MAAVAVAVTAIILGSGVSAALTNGRSVNPLDGVQQVVARITGDRTADQTAARDEARRHLARAQTFAERGQLGPARAEIDKATALLRRMTPEDATLIGKQAEALRKAIQ
jgi:hypothetical protein